MFRFAYGKEKVFQALQIEHSCLFMNQQKMWNVFLKQFEQSVCVHDYDLLLLCVIWYGGNVSLCGMENYPYPRHRIWWTFKVTIEEKHTNFQVNKDWYIYHSHKPTCTSTCWCWCCSTNTLLKKHPGKLKDDLTTKVWNQNLNSKCLKIVKIWRLHPVLVYFCFLTKRTEKSISSAINSSTFSHDFWIRSLLPFEHSGTVGVQPEAMDFTNFTNIKTCSDLFIFIFLWYPAGTTREERAECILIYLCHASWKEGL